MVHSARANCIWFYFCTARLFNLVAGRASEGLQGPGPDPEGEYLICFANLIWGSLFRTSPSWPPAREEGRVRAAGDDTTSGRSGESRESGESADEFQIVHVPSVFTAEVTRVTLWCNVFVYLFRDVSYKTIGFETTFGQTAFKSGLGTYDSVADVPQKVKKTSCDSSGSPGRLWRSGLALGASGKVS